VVDKKRNNWVRKMGRTATSILPVSKNRTGKCINCGECCKLPVKCIFLKYRPNGESFCFIHKTRPPNCRKYPRTKSECLTQDTCGYRFE